MKPAISLSSSNAFPLSVGVSVAACINLWYCLKEGNNAFPKCKNWIAILSPIAVSSVYNCLPSAVSPPLTVKSVAASVQIDSDINGFIISPLASLIPFKNPLRRVLSSCSPSITFNINVLKGLLITS